MRSIDQLARHAARLNQAAGSPAAPSLYFFTDPERTPDPVAIARRLPSGAAVVYRHFGASDRVSTARRLAEIAARRRLALLIAADPELAALVGAFGVHWPERLLPDRLPPGFHTAAAHDHRAALRAAAAGASVIVLGPVFATRSAAANRPIGLFRASQIAQLLERPVVALGGVNARTAKRLHGRGFAGLAAIDAFLP